MYVYLNGLKSYVILCVKVCILIDYRKLLVVFMCNCKEQKRLFLKKINRAPPHGLLVSEDVISAAKIHDRAGSNSGPQL
jgi:hypothetical protein